MIKAVCAQCGGESISLNVEIQSTGYRRIDASYGADGKLKVSEGHTESNHDGDDATLDYECADCGASAGTLEELLAPEGSALSGDLCACGHPKGQHPAQRTYNRKLFTRGRMACAEPTCGCWDFETDPVLATVVAA